MAQPPLYPPAVQDMPPKGGFAPIEWRRNLPARGGPGFLWFGAFAVITAFGMHRVSILTDKMRCVDSTSPFYVLIYPFFSF